MFFYHPYTYILSCLNDFSECKISFNYWLNQLHLPTYFLAVTLANSIILSVLLCFMLANFLLTTKMVLL